LHLSLKNPVIERKRERKSFNEKVLNRKGDFVHPSPAVRDISGCTERDLDVDNSGTVILTLNRMNSIWLYMVS
jgi:hypothetical protein